MPDAIPASLSYTHPQKFHIHEPKYANLSPNDKELVALDLGLCAL